jgi:hypothetical protein
MNDFIVRPIDQLPVFQRKGDYDDLIERLQKEVTSGWCLQVSHRNGNATTRQQLDSVAFSIRKALKRRGLNFKVKSDSATKTIWIWQETPVEQAGRLAAAAFSATRAREA